MALLMSSPRLAAWVKPPALGSATFGFSSSTTIHSEPVSDMVSTAAAAAAGTRDSEAMMLRSLLRRWCCGLRLVAEPNGGNVPTISHVNHHVVHHLKCSCMFMLTYVYVNKKIYNVNKVHAAVINDCQCESLLRTRMTCYILLPPQQRSSA